MQIILVLQVILGVTIQPYLLYKLKGNMKTFVFMEYLALFGISVIELCKFEHMFKSYGRRASGILSDLSFVNVFLYQLEILSIIERHCIYVRKGILTLIILDFYQLLSNPLEFKEYTSKCNQLKRSLVMFTFTVIILLFNYVMVIMKYLNFELGYIFAQNPLYWMISKELVAGLVSSSLFYIGITVLSSVLLYHMVRQEKSLDSQPGTNQAKVRPLILATVTFLVVIVSSYIMELVMILREKIMKSSRDDVVPPSDIIRHVHYYHEGVCGFVVMMSLFFWFPRLRPTQKQN